MRHKVYCFLSLLICCVIVLSSCGNEVTVVGTTTQGTPIVDVDIDDIKWIDTAHSECFSEIAYDNENRILYVRFRESGASYRYLGFSESDWEMFIAQESLGNWYNKAIKGQYECQKIEE